MAAEQVAGALGPRPRPTATADGARGSAGCHRLAPIGILALESACLMSRFYPAVTEPLRGPGAFAEISEVASQPQAAILLLLARQIRGDGASRREQPQVAESPTPSEWDVPDGETSPIPRIGPSHEAFSAKDVQARVRAAHGAVAPRRVDAMAYASCAERLYQRPGVDTAADLMEMCLSHPRELVRIAAAYAYLPLTTAPSRCVRHLVRGLKSADELEADLAATALAQIYPEHAALRRLSRKRATGGGGRPAHTLTLVHGTWASGAEWYQPPAGSFFRSLRRCVRTCTEALTSSRGPAATATARVLRARLT